MMYPDEANINFLVAHCSFPQRRWDLRVMADAFIPQRRFFDFRPHDVHELYATADGPDRMLSNRLNMFVVAYQGQIVAIAELENNFIDTIGVDATCRGRGYGRALMQHCINVLRVN